MSDLLSMVKFIVFILKKFQKQGIGFKLLKCCFEGLKQKGHNQAYLWVLEHNPTIQFYCRSGAKQAQYVLEDVIGSQPVKELCYVWENLD